MDDRPPPPDFELATGPEELHYLYETSSLAVNIPRWSFCLLWLFTLAKQQLTGDVSVSLMFYKACWTGKPRGLTAVTQPLTTAQISLACQKKGSSSQRQLAI